jgi:autotransporter-associated beta strand protein
MSPRRHPATRARFVIAAAVTSTLPAFVAPTLAQTSTGWTGGSSADFSLAGNWDNGAPDNASVRNLFFGQGYVNAGGTGSLTATANANFDLFRITFQDVGSDASAANDRAFVLNGTGTLNLFDFSGQFPKIENLSYVAQTINNNVTLTGNATGKVEINAVNGDLTLGGSVTFNSALDIFGNNGRTLTFGGALNAGSNVLTVKQNSIVAVNGAFTSNANVNVYAGRMDFGASATNSGTGTLFLGDTTGTATAEIRVAGGGTLSRNITVNSGSTGTKTLSSTHTTGTATVSGGITVNSGATLTLSASTTAGGLLAINGNLSGSGAINVLQSVSSNTSTLPNIRLGGSNSGYTGTITMSGSNGILLGSPSAMTGGLIDLTNSNQNLWLTANSSASPYTFGIDGTQTTGARIKARGAGTSGLFLTGGDVYWDPGNGGNYAWSGTGTSNVTVDFGGSNDSTPRMLYLGNTSGQFAVTVANKTFRNAGAGNNASLVTLRSALADGNEAAARTLSSGVNLLVLTQPAVNVSATNRLNLTVSAGATAISNVNQLPGGNLNLSGGSLVLDGISWSDFAAARAAGTGNGQYQLTGGGFGARTSAVTIDTTGTTAATFDRNFILGSPARNTDGTFYANAGVTISRDISLTAARTITLAHTGPGLTGTTAAGVVYRISGNLSGAGAISLQGNATGSNTVFRNAIGELVLSGSNNNFTGGINSQINTGPGGLAIPSSHSVFFRFDDTGLSSGTSIPSGDGSTPNQFVAIQQNSLQNGDTNGFAYGFLFTGDADGQVYNLPAYTRIVLGTVDAASNRPGTIGAASNAGTGGSATLGRGVIAINGGANSTVIDQGLFVRDGTFQLGNGTDQVRFIPTFSAAVASASTRTALADNATGTRTLFKRGSGTLVLNNVDYTTLGSDGQGTGGSPTASAFTWQIGGIGLTSSYDATSSFAGAVRETGSASTNSLSGVKVNMSGGVIEFGAAPRPIVLGTLAGQVNLAANGGGGFAAFGAPRSLGLNANAQLTWAITSQFVGGSQALILGSTTANDTLTLTNNISLNGAARTINTVRGTGNAPEAELSGVISGGNGSNLVLGGLNSHDGTPLAGGRLLLSNAGNTYSGSTTVNAGTLLIGSDVRASAGVTSVNAATERITLPAHGLSVNSPVVFSGTTAGGLTAHTVYYVRTVVDGDTFTVGTTPGAASDVNITGTTTSMVANFASALGSGSSSAAINLGDTSGSRDAAVLINGAFTVSRGVTVQAGSTGTLTIGGNTNANAVFAGTVTLNRAVTVSGVASGSNATSFTGDIVGGQGVTKAGAGVVIFGGTAKTYTGDTTVTAGTLLATANLASANINVTGGQFGGTATVNAIAATSGGTVAPGTVATPVGTLTASSLALNSGSTLAVDVNLDTAAQTASSDQVSTASFTLGSGTASLSLVPNVIGGGAIPSAVFVIVSNTGGGTLNPATSYFSGLQPNTGDNFKSFNFSGLAGTIYYNYDVATGNNFGGNDIAVSLTSVPEPGTLSVLGFAAAGLLRRRKRVGGCRELAAAC